MRAPSFIAIAALWSLLVATGAAQTVSLNVIEHDGSRKTLTKARFRSPWKIDAVRNGKPVEISAGDLVSIRFTNKPQKPSPPGPLLVFPTGELLGCRMRGSDDVLLSVDGPVVGKTTVPIGAVLGVVLEDRSSRARVAELVERIRATDRNSDQLLLRNDDVLSGTFLGLDERAVRFDREGDETTVPFNLVAAIAFDPTLVDYDPGNRFHGQLRLKDGSLINVADIESDESGLKIETTFGTKFSCDSTDLVAMALRNGRVVYLSDLEPLEAVHRPFLDDPAPYRADRSVLGGPLRVGNRLHAKGIGVRSLSTLKYDPSGFGRFEATVGLDVAAGDQASVRFVVLVDGKQMFDSGEMDASTDPQEVVVAFDDAKRLELIVEYAKRGDVQDYADWCSARFIR